MQECEHRGDDGRGESFLLWMPVCEEVFNDPFLCRVNAIDEEVVPDGVGGGSDFGFLSTQRGKVSENSVGFADIW